MRKSQHIILFSKYRFSIGLTLFRSQVKISKHLTVYEEMVWGAIFVVVRPSFYMTTSWCPWKHERLKPGSRVQSFEAATFFLAV